MQGSPVLPSRCGACLMIVVPLLVGCGRSAPAPVSTNPDTPRSSVATSPTEPHSSAGIDDVLSDKTQSASGPTNDATAAADDSQPIESENPNFAPAADPWEALPQEARERLVLLTPVGPVIVDVWILVDGRPYAAARDAYLCRLLDVASPGEASRITWSEALASGRFASMVGGAIPTSLRDAEQSINRYDRDRDGHVDWDEAGRYVDRVADSGSLFELEARAADLGSSESAWRGGLFSRLDRDGDGRLSEFELQSASELLESFDMDGDGLVAATEASSRGAMGGSGAMSMSDRSDGPPLAERLGPATRWDSLYFGLGEMYGGIDTASATDRPLVAALLARLDADGSGMISRRELNGMETMPPDLRCVIRFGGASVEAACQVEPNRELEAWRDAEVRSSDDGTNHAIIFESFELQIRSTDLVEPSGAQFAGDDAARARFEGADANDDGFLDIEEFLSQQAGGYGSFELVDADHDGMVDLEETIEFARLRDVPRRTAIRASADVDLDSLFARLDASGDRRLSAREIRAIATSITALDRDGDGSVAFAEVPSLVTLQIGRGPGGATEEMPVGRVAGRMESVPSWFRRMDANGDGDVAMSEFLGGPERFAAIDLDGDGFLDADEAKTSDTNSQLHAHRPGSDNAEKDSSSDGE